MVAYTGEKTDGPSERVGQQSEIFAEAVVQIEARVRETRCERGLTYGRLLEGGGPTACDVAQERKAEKKSLRKPCQGKVKGENRRP